MASAFFFVLAKMDPQFQKNVHGIAIRITPPSDDSFYVRGTSITSNEERGHRNVRTEDMIQWEIEKLRIWDDRIEREVAYKRALEAELRREILLEELATQRPARISSSSMLMPTSHHRGGFGWGLDERNHLKATTIDTTIVPKGKLLVLPQEVHLSSGTKRKRGATSTTEPSKPFSVGNKNKKKKLQGQPRKWTCKLCKVSATSEQGLRDHLRGKKHKAKAKKTKGKKRGQGRFKANKKCSLKTGKFNFPIEKVEDIDRELV